MRKMNVEHQEVDLHLSKVKINNLKKLANYLMSDHLEAEFDMSTYNDDGSSYKLNCGAVGCAVGHGPYAGIKKIKTESWNQYCTRNFCDVIMLGSLWTRKRKTSAIVYAWLFYDEWSVYDNTPKGAAKRIMYMLEHGIPDFNNNFEQLMPEYQLSIKRKKTKAGT